MAPMQFAHCRAGACHGRRLPLRATWRTDFSYRRSDIERHIEKHIRSSFADVAGAAAPRYRGRSRKNDSTGRGAL